MRQFHELVVLFEIVEDQAPPHPLRDQRRPAAGQEREERSVPSRRSLLKSLHMLTVSTPSMRKAVPSIEPRCATTIACTIALAFNMVSSNSSSASDNAITAPPTPIDN